MKKSLIAIASILAIVAGCAKNDPQAKVSDGTIKASIENTQSRATLSYGGETDNFLVWEEEDSFLLFDGTSGIKCDLVSGVGEKFGSFTPESDPEQVDTYYAVYPYNNSSVGTDGVFSVVIPDEVSYNPATGVAEMGEDGSANVMVAKSSSTEIAFKNVCSYVCLTVTGTSDQKVSSIDILPKDGETTVAGTAQITFNEENPVLTFDGTVASNAESVVFAEPVSLENGLDLKVAVAPVYTDGIQVIVTLENGEYQILTSNTTIGRNEIVDMPEFAFAATEVAEVGGENYTTLAAAVAAANEATEDVTINMLADAASSSAVEINNTNGKKITLNLDGKIVSSNIIVTTDFEVADATGIGVVEAEKNTIKMGEDKEFGVKATFTLNGGTVRTFGGNYAISADGVSGTQPTVIVKKGNIIGEGGNAVRIKYATATFGDETEGDIVLTSDGNNAIWTSTSAAVEINKGSYTNTKEDGAVIYSGDGSANITIKNGVFTSNAAMFSFINLTSNPTIDIKDGKFSWDNSVLFQTSNTKSTVSGGYFTAKVPAANVASGYVCNENSDVTGYSFKVVERSQSTFAIKVAETEYRIEEFDNAVSAINAATTNTDIVIMSDINLAHQFVINNSSDAELTLDLNGYKITAPTIVKDEEQKAIGDTVALLVQKVKKLEIKDSSEGQGEINQCNDATCYTMCVQGGTVDITGGKIFNTVTTGYGRVALRVDGSKGSTSTVNISGGHIKGGRAIRIGSGSSSKKSYVNITGGLVEGTYSSSTSTSFYSPISFERGYGYLTITGGTVVANQTQSVIYTSMKNTSITIGDKDDTSKKPYFYNRKDKGYVFGGSNVERCGSYTVYNCFCSKDINAKATGPTTDDENAFNVEITEISKISDNYGYEYTYQMTRSVD